MKSNNQSYKSIRGVFSGWWAVGAIVWFSGVISLIILGLDMWAVAAFTVGILVLYVRLLWKAGEPEPKPTPVVQPKVLHEHELHAAAYNAMLQVEDMEHISQDTLINIFKAGAAWEEMWERCQNEIDE